MEPSEKAGEHVKCQIIKMCSVKGFSRVCEPNFLCNVCQGHSCAVFNSCMEGQLSKVLQEKCDVSGMKVPRVMLLTLFVTRS